VFVESVLVVFSRSLLGWSITDHLRSERCTDASAAALGARGKPITPGTVFHSAPGCQYTSDEFWRFCRQGKITQSMATVGDSYDNAMVKSFWSSLTRELARQCTRRSDTRLGLCSRSGAVGRRWDRAGARRREALRLRNRMVRL